MTMITATIKTADGDVKKNFNVEVKSNAHIYSPELIEWVENTRNRTSNYIWITANNKEYIYSI